MLEYDCEALPVANNQNKAIGMITDSDITIDRAKFERPSERR
jgi:Mg/Co/Ni transporter MgtE